MKRRPVVLSPQAQRQLSGLEQWIEGEASASVARRYREAIVAHCRRLEKFPDRGSPRDDLRGGLRTLTFRRRVTIGYIVEDDEVVVIAIAGYGRDLAAAVREG